MFKRVDRLTLKLAVGITFLVVFCLSGALYLFTSHYYKRQLSIINDWALAQGNLVGVALEDQMLKKDRSLIIKMVNNFARDPAVERVMILDRMGVVKHSSDPALRDHRFPEASRTCKGCHQLAPEQRTHSIVLDTAQGRLLRTVRPVENRPSCHECHSPADRINGMIILDVPMAGLRRRLMADVNWMIGGTGVLAVFLLGGIGLVVRQQVLERLRRFEFAARSITRGDLHQRVHLRGDDALQRLAVDFNKMADSTENLLVQLSCQQRQLENIMNSVDDGVLVLDTSRTIVAVNDSFLRRFAQEREDVLNMPCSVVSGMPTECDASSSCPDCPAARCFDKAQYQWAMRRRTGEDGGERIEEVRVSPVYDEKGAVHQVVEVWRDITDRRSAEAQMAEFQRLASLGMFASGFSHEVNTPLASALTCVDGILRQGAAVDQPTKEVWADSLEWAEIARSEILRCKRITSQILQLSRGEMLDRDVLAVCDVVKKVLPLVRKKAQDSGVSVVLANGAEPPPVLANRNAVQHVLLNLLNNALQACERGGTVRIEVCDRPQVEIHVHDDGPGIPADLLSRIFEPFFSTSRAGTGLGLFISKNLARNWGGDVSVTSTVGVGSCFHVSFPVEEPDDGAGPDTAR